MVLQYNDENEGARSEYVRPLAFIGVERESSARVAMVGKVGRALDGLCAAVLCWGPESIEDEPTLMIDINCWQILLLME